MSTSASFENYEEFQEALGTVRSDSTKDVYAIINHVENDPTRVAVLKVGQDVEEIAENLDSQQVNTRLYTQTYPLVV